MILRCLEAEGITHVFGVPGEQILPLVDAVYDSDRVRFISNRHEGGASFMAEAYGKYTGKPAVCLATAAVGAANLTIGIHTAMQDSTPMIVIIGQVNSGYLEREAWQEVPLDHFYGQIAKKAFQIHDGERIPEFIHHAVQYAVSGRPGPVVVSVPEDLLERTFDYGGAMHSGGLRINPPSLAAGDADAILQELIRAERPVILAGGGILQSGAKQDLVRLSEELNVPVMVSFRRHDAFPNEHPHFAGHSGLGTFPEIVRPLQEADLVIAIGTRLSEITTQRYAIPGRGQKVIHIDIDPNVIVNQPFQASGAYVSDAGRALRMICARVVEGQKRAAPDFSAWVSRCRANYVNTLQQRRAERDKFEHASLRLESVIDVMARTLPPNAVLTSDAGTFYTWFSNYFTFLDGQRYLGPTSGAMGYGLPAAVAAKLADPERTVVSLSGDGGLMMTVQEFETAVRYDVPMISMVFNNNSYGAIRLHQQKRFPGRVIGSGLTNPSFAELARCFGGIGFTADSEEALEQAMVEAVKLRKPAMIEVAMDPKFISAAAVLPPEQ